eukprot:TRINITY_DN8321_c0_g2_i1.p1 TRINITY_DN8321_c0_g2~~TRINITY_DN8321_c0_g2_i1.p1  ORF type:complete len:193 (+),score=63.62 TRINITY_DN8321_c0_g2_i1:85-579(+)
MVAEALRKPTVLWAQRQDSVYVAVDIKDACDLHVSLEEASLDFRGSDGDGASYGFVLEFYGSIQRQQSKWSSRRRPEFVLRKQKTGTWPRLSKESKLSWIKVDWSKWADSDEEDEKGAFDTNQMDGLDAGRSTAAEEESHDDEDDDKILADLDEDIELESDAEA